MRELENERVRKGEGRKVIGERDERVRE